VSAKPRCAGKEVWTEPFFSRPDRSRCRVEAEERPPLESGENSDSPSVPINVLPGSPRRLPMETHLVSEQRSQGTAKVTKVI